MQRSYCVYIISSQRNGTLYIGVTNDLARRIHEHKTKATPGFTSRYDVCNLVWYEEHADINDAIAREKSLKRWERKWKLKLIEAANPEWLDLYDILNR
jgi:putative endonuclease